MLDKLREKLGLDNPKKEEEQDPFAYNRNKKVMAKVLMPTEDEIKKQQAEQYDPETLE